MNEDFSSLLGPSVHPPSWRHSLIVSFRLTSGDLNAFFGVMLDNVANLAVIASLLINVFHFPSEFVYRNMFPGTAFGVMLGSFALCFMAIRLNYNLTNKVNERGEKIHVTAIPVGLDAPTCVGLPLIVIGPAFLAAQKRNLSENDAALEAWYLGCATVVLIGIIKAILSIFGEHIQRIIPAAGKQGALAAIGLALLGQLQLLAIIQEPVAGLFSLWFLLLILIHRYDVNEQPISYDLPYKLSGVMVAATCGTIIYYAMAFAKISIIPMPSDPTESYSVAFYPHPADFYSYIGTAIKQYGAIAVPYAILVNVGGFTIVSAAKQEENDYNTVAVTLADAVCTILTGMVGGVSQTTPYIGHSVYHRVFKANASYTLWTGLFVGLGGLFGYISFVSKILPKAAIMPIFVFVAFEIVACTFHDPNPKPAITKFHAPAVIFALFPAIAQMLEIILSQIDPILSSSAIDPETVIAAGFQASTVELCAAIVVLAHGFIATSLIWGSSLSFVIDGELLKAGVTLSVGSVLAFFGVIHSVASNGSVYLPWELSTKLPFHWAAGYLLMAVTTILSKFLLKPASHSLHSDDISIAINSRNAYKF